MAVIFRPVTKEDLDHLFALEDAKQLDPFVGPESYRYEHFFEEDKHIAIDEEKATYLIRLPQRSIQNWDVRYVLVCEGKIIISSGGRGGRFAITYISPALVMRLGELTPFLREAFGKGGEHLDGHPNDSDRYWAAIKEFYFLDKEGV